jgi:GNAT superfamily N-acetyltransferase
MYGRLRVSMPMPDDAFCLANLRVDEAHRGRGIGTALMHWGGEEARELGYRRIALQTMMGSPAIRLYERLGYRITRSRTHPCYLGGSGRCLMERAW